MIGFPSSKLMLFTESLYIRQRFILKDFTGTEQIS